MPPICDAECRTDIWAALMNDLRDDWKKLMDGINLGFETAKMDTRALIEEAYWAADVCDPDCKCENIMIEYDSVAKVQDELSDTIVELLATYANLEAHQTDILDVCPSYREVDGDIFYDL